MARKSGWQEFAENFQGVYGTFKQIGQDVETGRIMDDEKFTAEGAAGAGLSGSALDKARYKALGDIYTKYGNAKEGLAVRTQLADLDAKDRENTINASILDELKYLRGKGAVRNLDSGSSANEARAALSFGRLNTENALRDGKVENQTLNNAGLRIANDTSQLAYDLGLATQPGEIAATNTSNQSIVNQAPSADAAAIASNQSIVNQAPSADAAAIATNNLTSAQASNNLTLEDLRTQAGAEQYRVQVYEAYAAGNQAQINELQTLGFLDYSKRFSDGEFKTAEDAKDAYLGVVAQFDPTKAMEMAKKYSADEIGALANQGLKIQTEMNKILQKPGKSALEAARTFFDKQNGDATGVTLRETENGYEMFETVDGENVDSIFQNLSVDDAKSALQGVTTYGNATNYAEKLYARKVSNKGLQKTDAEIANLEQRTETSGAQADALMSSIGLDTAKVEKINADIEKINNDVKNADTTKSVQIKEEGLQRFLSGDTYGYMLDSNPQGAANLLGSFKYNTGMLSPALYEAGISLQQYLNMPDEDKAQFEN